MIRVVAAEDTYLVREGIRRLLELEPDIELVAACEDLPLLLVAIEAEQPDVVLTDIRMPPCSQDEGIQVADRLRETSSETGVVVLSQFAAPEYASIVYAAQDGLHLIGASTAAQVRLTDDRTDVDPAWSPNGSTIVFVRGNSLYRINPDGSDECAECGRRWTDPAERWTARLTDDDESVLFCSECDEREFGDRGLPGDVPDVVNDVRGRNDRADQGRPRRCGSRGRTTWVRLSKRFEKRLRGLASGAQPARPTTRSR